MKKMVSAVAMGVVLCLSAVPATAVDGISVEIGGGDGTDIGRIAIQWDWNKRWFQGSEWHLGGYWELALGHWRYDAVPGQNREITEIGLTPVLRLQRNELTGPYAEAGVGIHLLSETRIGDKRLSTQFQFGDHVGVGYRFGARSAWDVGYRYQHLSNASIKKPNNGINFHQVRLQYHF